MASFAGVGAITTLSSAGAFDIPEDITSAAVGKGQDIGSVPDRESNLTISIETIIMGALIFIGILSWFEFLRSWYDHTFSTDNDDNFNAVYNRFWYAVFISCLVLILMYVVYRIATSDNSWDLTIKY
jgi:hypothetical protein